MISWQIMRPVVCLVLFAMQLGSEQLPFRLFTVSDGLVRDGISRIRRDPKGFLWICTAEGLSLFDGVRFTNYTVADGLPDGHVYDVLTARDGSYWLATGAGVIRFFPRRALYAGENQKPRFEPVQVSGAAIGAIRVLLEDHSGAIWAGGAAGLYRLDRSVSSMQLEPVPLEPAGGIVLSLFEDARKRMWIGTTGGLYRWSGAGTATLAFQSRDVAAILMDQHGYLWIGQWGLTCLDPDTEPITRRQHLGVADSPALGNRVFDLKEAANGDLWIAAFGLLRLRSDAAHGRRRLQAYQTVPYQETQFVSSLELDSRGNVWVGNGTLGLSRLVTDGFSNYDESDGLESKRMMGLIESRAGKLIAVSAQRCAWSEFDGERFHSFFPQCPASVHSLGWGVGRVLLQDRVGDWWVATEDGLLHYTASGAPDQMPRAGPKEVLGEKDGLPSHVILHLFEDSHGDIWAGTLTGVGRRDRATGRWHSYLRQVEDGPPPVVEAIAEDSAGGVWVGMSDPVSRKTPSQTSLVRIRGQEVHQFTRGMPRDINNLFVDSHGRLWIASGRDGLGRIDRPTDPNPAVRFYGTSDGLSSTDLYSIAEDRKGRLYLAGGRGVDCLNPDNGQVHHFTTEGGLLPGRNLQVFADRDGDIWFVSTLGLSRLRPHMEEPSQPPAPTVRSVRTSGQTSMISDLGENAVGGLALGPGSSSLEIELGALRFNSAEKVRYQYRLHESEPWSSPVDLPVLSLAGFSPGRYRLSVRTINEEGVSSPVVATVGFEALPPFWGRWWFRAIAALVLGFLAYALHRFRLGRLLEMERVRTRIAADLHDDIGASLSQVAVLSEVVRRRANDAAIVQQHSEKIASISRELVASMSDIVWAVNPRHDSLPDLTRRMREFADEVLTARDIRLQFDASNADGQTHLGADVRRQVFLIFKEAVNNAARHSGSTVVGIRISVDRSWLVMNVTDNGYGFDRANGAGNGLNNMRHRAESMKGTFEAESHEEGGACLSIRVPLN